MAVPAGGGDWYQDKPPLFFWFMAMAYAATGVLRVAFLLPSLLAALGCLLLVHDLGRRLWSREAGLLAALLLLFTVQFTVQARVAQIDMTLCLLSTAGLYGIARHLLLGPDWRAYAFGGFACGLGVITKGAGFLPLLAVLPVLFLRARGFAVSPGATAGWRWCVAPLATLAAIALWLVPMVLTVTRSGDPGLAAYRDELLFRQTVTRYASASSTALAFLPDKRHSRAVVAGCGPAALDRAALARPWRARDARPWLMLGWIALVLLFFGASPGKRGVYILPALPSVRARRCGRTVAALTERRGVQRVGFALALAVGLVLLGAGMARLVRSGARRAPHAALRRRVAVAAAGRGSLILGTALLAGARRGFLAWAATLAILCWIQGLWINPQLDASRSGRDFMRRVEAHVPSSAELGLAGYREQFLLQATRPVVNFGHRRWREGRREAEDAALWLDARADRVLLVDAVTRRACFATAVARSMGAAGGVEWFLVTGRAAPDCASRGRASAAIPYLARGAR